MGTVPANPKVEAIRKHVADSNASLHQLIDGPLSHLDAGKLYQSPAEDEWTIMQNLAHVVEFMPYWAGEVEKILAEPGCAFGRSPDDAARLQGISQHEMDSLSKIKAALPGSYARLDEVLGKLKDSDLELTGKHVRYGEKSVGWLIDDLICTHL
ncbi:MAG TPA: DinB family protein, partial [Ktedonobacteraceae bacterium]|nr:DinB family protein [Ktedonobacteraceae bacterium]